MGQRKNKLTDEQLQIIKNEYVHIMRTLSDLLESHGIRYFVSFGTLLGLYRDGDLLNNDSDVDFFLDPTSFNEGFIRHLTDNYEELMHDTFKKPLERCIMPHVFDHMLNRSNVYVQLKDIIYTIRKPSVKSPILNGIFLFAEMCCYYPHPYDDTLLIREVGRTMYNVIRKELFDTHLVETKYGLIRMPKNTEQFLEDEYGKGWKVPDPNFRTSFSNVSKVGYFKRKTIGDLFWNPNTNKTHNMSVDQKTLLSARLSNSLIINPKKK